jgi:heme exporter protein B
MTRWLRVCALLIGKELRLESRGRELITLLFCNGLLMTALVSAGASSAILEASTARKLFPMLFWLVFLFSTTGAMVRSNEYELEGRGFEGLLLAGVSGPQMYIAKVLVASVTIFLNFSVTISLLALGLGQDISGIAAALAAVGCVSSLCLAALLVLLSTIASTSRLKGVLLPLISLPLLFPLFFIGIEMVTQLTLRGVLDLYSVWPTLMVSATAVYLIIGVNVFDVACRE